MSNSLNSVKAKNEARMMEEQRVERRRMALLVLIHNHLLNSGYIEAAERLQAECGITMSKHEVADNIDLTSILQDYEDYFQMRFNKAPKFVRKKGGSSSASASDKFAAIDKYSPGGDKFSSDDPITSKAKKSTAKPKKERTEVAPLPSPASSRSNSNSNLSLPRIASPSIAAPPLPPTVSATASGHTTLSLNGVSAPTVNNPARARVEVKEDGGDPKVKIKEGDMGLVGKSTQPSRKNSQTTIPLIMDHDETPVHDDFYDYKLLKPLPSHLTGNSEFRELAAIITRDIFFENPNVKWTDIVGLENAKKLLNEAVAMPLKYPQLFTGLLTPWKGILLFGPPGTGKTMLAKAVASMSRTTFFNISAASIVSKWRGDSEKLVRVLFELARHHAPSTIFLDEIDALMSHRGGGDSGGEHEASRRMKTELLIQVDGLARSTEQVFLLAVSNLPWMLDSALLRRLEKRIYVPLPNQDAREDMFKHYLSNDIAPNMDYENLAAQTEGYSGSDIRLVCKESAMAPLRRLLECLERGEKQYNEELKTEPITEEDVAAALKSTKSSAHRDLEKYTHWQQEFGSV